MVGNHRVENLKALVVKQMRKRRIFPVFAASSPKLAKKRFSRRWRMTKRKQIGRFGDITRNGCSSRAGCATPEAWATGGRGR